MQAITNNAQTLMVQGTTSDAGKSALVTALCRYYFRSGIKVAPFKPQNMALNSAVTVDSGEIGRAQAVQATACGLEPHTDMNPVLLKPNTDKTAQVIIHGQAVDNQSAWKYHGFKRQAMQAVLESHARLLEQYSMIVVEGAGSPAEINLREGDIANMGFAEKVDCPVILIADIDKGGVFAHLVGTLDLLSASEQARIVGFVINRFRGDIALLQPGIDWLEERTGKPVFAVLPYLQNFYLDAEDALAVAKQQTDKEERFKIVIPVFPRISNHTDFDPLTLHPELTVQFVRKADECQGADLIILPGSKSVRDDLQWLKNMGWEAYISRHLRYGGRLMGICGGYQMLGNKVHDPLGIEGNPGSSDGLGYLSLETTLKAHKHLRKTDGHLLPDHTPISGYEIHAGETTGEALKRPVMILNGRQEGAYSEDNQIMGSYLHGLFDQAEASQAILKWAGCDKKQTIDLAERREAGINLIADALEQNFDFNKLNTALARFQNKTGVCC